MQKKFIGLLLTILGIVALILADVNLMKAISYSSYTLSLHAGGSNSSPGMAVLGYTATGLLLIFLGIRIFRNTSSA